MISLITIIVILIIIYVTDQIRRPPNYPPGPAWLPIVGNLPLLKKLSRSLGGQHIALSHLAKKYNTNVLGLKLGSDYVIAVFSYETVRSVLTGDEYESRPDNFFMKLRSMGTRKGITGTDGDLWRIQRNFVMSHLRSLGLGKQSMGTMIRDEIKAIKSILRDDGNDVEINKIIAPVILNILWTLVAGSRICREDKKLVQLLELMEIRRNAFDMSGGTLSLYPWLRHLAPKKTGYDLLQYLNKQLREFFMTTINEHYESWRPERNDDLIYSFITEMKKSNDSTFTEDQLIMVCLDLFIGGAQTTSTTLDFVFLLMILHPEIQRKVQQQLDDAFDPNTVIVYSEKTKVPYVEAVLYEVERYRHVVPITGPRRVLKDTVLEGYHIPKDTTVLISSYSVHNDEKYWKDPHVFRPERFLDANGELIGLERLIPFGLGKRRCLGEILAKNCLFTIFAEIIRTFKVTVKCELPTDVPLPGITLSPKSYKASFEERKQF